MSATTMQGTPILEKIGAQGKRIRLIHSRYLYDATIDVEVNGAVIQYYDQLCPVVAAKRVPGGVTHYCGRVGLTAAEAETVRAAVSAHQEFIERGDPRVRVIRLKERRSQ